MRLIVLLLLIGTFAGCNRHQSSASPTDTSTGESIVTESAFKFEKLKSRILLDTRVAPGQRETFWIGLGSMTIETISANSGMLTINYTPEEEGGYTVYECNLPISDEPVVFEIDPAEVPGKTSFDLNDCKVLKTGNLLLE